MVKGFIIGKFMPLTKGHQYLIEFGARRCDELTVMLAAKTDEPIDYMRRMLWLMHTYNDRKNIRLVMDIVDEPEDMSDEEKSNWWGNRIKNRWGKYDVVFSSENYGERFAKAMGARHEVCDIDRKILPISATKVREKPLTNWSYISRETQPYYVKKVGIVGTESTGKTTLCKQLAEHYNTNWAKEIGREVIPDTDKCTIDDLRYVGYEHIKNMQETIKNSNKLVFVDTDIYITRSYSKFLFNDIPNWPYWVYEECTMDLLIFLNSDAPYVNDGTRMSDEDRKRLELSHLETYASENIFPKRFPFNGSYEKRFEDVVFYIDEFLTKF